MKRTFLSRLRTNGIYHLVGSLLLLVGVPLYQFAVLTPQGYSAAQAAAASGHFGPYLLWIQQHSGAFLVSRLLLVVAFACLWSLPFSLFRIIVAQEILGREDEDEVEYEEDGEDEDGEEDDDGAEDEQEEENSAMPADAWRGRGFAVLAAWSGLAGIVLFALATLISSIYLVAVSSSYTAGSPLPGGFAVLSRLFSILTYTVGGGLIALTCLLFGVVIARAGLKLWPGVWVAFGYLAIALTALLSGSAVAIASVANESQSIFTTPSILLFAVWALWFAIMLTRLKPEP
jgi:hypothetical protein